MNGRTISHYTVIEKIGEGGMGVVYKAVDSKLQRPVAIKLLASDLHASDAARQRFLNEARAAAAVDHPNISTVYEVGETDDGHIFIAMAFYQGESLRDRLARGPLSIAEAISITRQIALGLAEVHAKGIIHRDIKPANIIITDNGTAKLVDFGLALLAEATKLTRSGTTLGTVSYMSPEQVRAGTLDARSDIFSLGCVLHEMITGRATFGDTHEAAILYAILNEKPSSLAKYRSDVPAGTQAILDRMLAKSPDGRYRSVLDVLTDIDRLQNAPRSGRRTKRLVMWTGLSAVVVIGALILWKIQQSTPSQAQQHSLAVIDFREVSPAENQYLSSGLTGLLQIGLIENAPCRVVSTEYLYDLRRRLFGSSTGPITQEQALEVARKSGADVLLTGQCASEGSGYFVTWQLVDTRDGAGLGAKRVDGAAMTALADGVIGQVLPLLASHCGSGGAPAQTPIATLTTSSADAYHHYVVGLAAMDRVETMIAIREFETSVGIDSTFALAWFALARARGGRADNNTLERGEPGCAAGERAWALRSRLGVKDRIVLEGWLARACRWDVSGALEIYRELVARWPDDREMVTAFIEMLVWNHRSGEAIPTALNALERYPDDVKLKRISATAFGCVGHLRKSLALYHQVVDAEPDNANDWDNLALNYLALGLPDSAEIAFKRALEITPGFGISTANMAFLPFYRGDTAAAIRNLRALQGKLSAVVEQRVETNLQQLLAESGRFDEAFERNSQNWDLNIRDYMYLLLTPDTSRQAETADRLRKAMEDPFAGWPGYLPPKGTPVRVRGEHGMILSRALDADSLEIARAELRIVQEMLEADGESLNSWWWMGMAEFSLADGKPRDALRYLQKVEELAYWPASESILYFDIRRRIYLAHAYRMLGEYDQARAVLVELKRIYPGHYRADFELGQVYEDMKRPADAIASYERFLKNWADADPGLAHLKLAREHLAALKSPP